MNVLKIILPRDIRYISVSIRTKFPLIAKWRYSSTNAANMRGRTLSYAIILVSLYLINSRGALKLIPIHAFLKGKVSNFSVQVKLLQTAVSTVFQVKSQVFIRVTTSKFQNSDRCWPLSLIRGNLLASSGIIDFSLGLESILQNENLAWPNTMT